MGSTSGVSIELEDALSSEGSFASTVTGQCCKSEQEEHIGPAAVKDSTVTTTSKGEKSSCGVSSGNNYATNKNVAEGLMDIALLSANANQLRFLITYNHEASTYLYSLILVILSLGLQVLVGIVLIFKRRLKGSQSRHYIRTNELLIMGVFLITVTNVLLAAFTTTDGHAN